MSIQDLLTESISFCRKAISNGTPEIEAVMQTVGGHVLADGLWRVFSAKYPEGGVDEWNEWGTWKSRWGIGRSELFCFGEDLFGNQLVMISGQDTSHLWDHETGRLFDLLVSPFELIETAHQYGINWIDQYSDEMIETGRLRVDEVSIDCHLHWTTPLILGGESSIDNTSVVERLPHLLGHADLWCQIQGIEPGTTIVVNSPGDQEP